MEVTAANLRCGDGRPTKDNLSLGTLRMLVTGENSEDKVADNPEMSNMASDRQVGKMGTRNMVSFWIFGLCNNFAYVVMLSAAHDILKEEEQSHNSSSSANSSTLSPVTTTQVPPNVTYLECNSISTGAILLADILPTLIVKLTFPFFIQKIPFNIKVSLVSVFILASFLIVAFAHDIWLSIVGIVCASIAGGLGEITFLSLTTFYHRNVVSMWSSGTGGAGIFGSLVYAGLTTAGLSPRNTLLIMIFVPVLMMVTYIFLLTKPKLDVKKYDDANDHVILLKEDEEKKMELTLHQKLILIPSLFKYMIPLVLVYFGEYFINQGLHEILYFNGVWLSRSEQYRWYQVDYQIGVFISRSSVNIIHIKQLWILPILQFINLAVLLCHVFFQFIPSIWVVFIIVLWEGLIGGAAYVNTFYKMTNELPEDQKEYCIGVATLGDAVGIAIAGAAAIPSHQAICNLHLKM
uniref:Battenin n=2 Tax=Arion vulgaris TaxID=1028688 RepID=A0A0B6ZW08_9EUPU